MGGKRERRSEGVEREAPTSLYDLRRLGGRLPTGQGLKSEYSARATHGYQKLQVSHRRFGKSKALGSGSVHGTSLGHYSRFKR